MSPVNSAQPQMVIPTKTIVRTTEQPVEGPAMVIRGGGCVKDVCICCCVCCAIEDICCCEIDDICC